MGRVLNTPPINLAPHHHSAGCRRSCCPREFAHNHKVVPVSRLENKLFLAMADPLNVLAIDDVKRITKLEVAPMIASEKAIIDKLNNLDAAKSGSMEDIIQDAAEDRPKPRRTPITSRVSKEADRRSQPRPTRRLQRRSAGHQAGQSHPRPGHQRPRERYSHRAFRERRCACVTASTACSIDATPPPKQMQLALASRFKIMSSLDIAERRLPQDGRMRMRVGGKDFDLRVSIHAHGARRKDRAPRAR